MVEEALARARPLVKVATEIIRTRGDHEHVTPSELDRTNGRKGIFTAELERALMEKRIDVAVHSAKDLPSEMHNALTITAVLPRGVVEDLLLRKSTAHAPVATIATGSVRRQRQTRWSNPAARVVGLRGNVPTRLRNSSKAIGTRLFWRAPAWSASDSCHRSLNLKARSFLPKYSRQKIFCRQAVRASSLCKHAQPIGSRAKSCRRLMTWKRIFVCERSGSFCGYCREIAICRWACALDL